MVVESYESYKWRKCLSTRQSQLTSGQMHFIKVCRVATICPLVQVVKSIFPLVSCRHYWTSDVVGDAVQRTKVTCVM